jgi:histidinol-phosphate aminotransferase
VREENPHRGVDWRHLGPILSPFGEVRDAQLDAAGLIGAFALSMEKRVSQGETVSLFWSELARDLSPYVPGEQPQIPGLVKLNTNESPFGPSPKAIEAIRAAASDSLRLYPDPQSSRLREALAGYHKVAPDQVFVGNGSDEVLAHAFAALLKQPKPVRFPDVTYSFYPVYCRLLRIAHVMVPLDAEMGVRVNDYLGHAGPVIIANPNAPTGIALPRTEIARLAGARTEAVVVIDEAYVDFGGDTAIPLIHDYPNLLVVQTMSKSRALAGLRVGYAVGDAALVEALTRVKDSFNSYPLGRPAQAGAIASLADEAHFQQARSAVMRNRADLTCALNRLGLDVLPSSANFVFARHPRHSGQALAAALRERAVLVRHFAAPRISDFLRITIGSQSDLGRLTQALSEILAESRLEPMLVGKSLADPPSPGR